MNDYILIHDFNVPEHKELETGLLNIDGKKIIRLPEQIGFHKTQQKYGVKNG